MFFLLLVFLFSEVIFKDMRRTVDRLKHLNKPYIIPDELILNNDKVGVTRLLYNMLYDDETYGKLDRPIDDEPRYTKVINHSAAEELFLHLKHNDPWMFRAINHPQPDHRIDVAMFPMPRKDKLPEVLRALSLSVVRSFSLA